MEYPIWQLTTLAGGFWIALIATVHVYVAQFAVGGGLFLVLTELLARKTGNDKILEYVKKHSKFFLLLTMVFGGVTGVGIWLTIALLSPQATITLIHTFVFGWAAEWVCFLGEIVALLCYYYGWKRLSRRDHLAMGWLYFLFAWLSLFLINGIIGFMLTPGDWMQTQNFWDGFFNPSFWPSLFFRTFLALMLAGLFGFVTATRVRDEETRALLTRTCAAWTVGPFLLFLLCGWWYYAAMPEAQHLLMAEKSQRVGNFLGYFWVFAPLTMLGGLALAVRMPRGVRFPLALVVLLLGLGMSGSFEFVREAGRKPFLIFGHTYSSSITLDQAASLNETGVLAASKWADAGLLETDVLEAGRMLYQIQCSACHSLHGPMNDLAERTEKFSLEGMEVMLTGLGQLNTYMPPFFGTEAEKKALARWIFAQSHEGSEAAEDVDLAALPDEAIPPFNRAAPEDGGSEYVLTAWADKGFVFFPDADATFLLLPPGNDLKAQLILRGDPPMRITEGVTIDYAIEKGFERTDDQGRSTSGTMTLEDDDVFAVRGVPVLPYPNTDAGKGEFQPYPLFTITAKDADGHILALTKTTAPASTEMGCKTCHGGDWKVEGRAGVEASTAEDVLATHDRMNKTGLAALAASGTPVRCQDCHGDQEGNDPAPQLNLSAAIHGAHAVYFAGQDSEACSRCHPTGMEGATRAFRGRHADFAECADCHGPMEDHALSLLRHEQQRGVPAATRLMARIAPRNVASAEEINPRQPWAQVPDCLSCHVDYNAPGMDAFNHWTATAKDAYRNRLDEMDALACAACHGPPHAIRPATNPYNPTRDSIVPLQYQGDPGTLGTGGNCICHTVDYDVTMSMHHPITED